MLSTKDIFTLLTLKFCYYKKGSLGGGFQPMYSYIRCLHNTFRKMLVHRIIRERTIAHIFHGLGGNEMYQIDPNRWDVDENKLWVKYLNLKNYIDSRDKAVNYLFDMNGNY